jgi:glycosyltransferase involved in cell wall biosynthesis
MKIALVHDYLREYGGAERVVEVMHEIWPQAPLYTAFVDFKSLGSQAYRFKDWDIRTSWVQHNPFVKKFISPLRFLAPRIWNTYDLSEYDVVLSSSGWFMCRGVALNNSKLRNPLHVCYIHHPPRNLYGYATGSDLQKYLPVRIYAAIVNFYLRHYDFRAAQAVDYFIANSKETAKRVMKFYRRDSTVIYPPINQPEVKSQKSKSKRDYYLSVCRLSWAKRVDVIIEAANTLKLPLKIVGAGKEMEHLKSIAEPTVEFMGSVDDQQLSELYMGAKALIFCALDEDFGMVPVESMAYGTPVIGLAQGGVLETVIDGKTGVLFDKPEPDSLINAIYKFEKEFTKINFYQNCITQANKFSKDRFKKELVNFVKEKLSENHRNS